MPYNSQKIDVEALVADNRMIFLQMVSERAGVATQKGGINLTFIPLGHRFYPLDIIYKLLLL